MEFHFVMDEYNRMLKWCFKNSKPLPTTLDDLMDDVISISDFEDIVINWGKEHPSPKYPRFIDIFDDMIQDSGNPDWKNQPMVNVMMEEIPEQVAIRYGIKPINSDELDYGEESEWR